MDETTINSYSDANTFIKNMFGDPDYFSKAEDITDVEEYLDEFRTELETLERYVKNVEYKNINHFKLNRSITLHFLLEAGDDYIELLREVIDTKQYEVQLDELEEEVADINTKYNWEN